MSKHCVSCNLARIKQQFEAKMAKKRQEKVVQKEEVKQVEPMPELIAAAIIDAMNEPAFPKKSKKRRDNIEEQKDSSGSEMTV